MWVLKLLTLINWSWSSQYLRDLHISKNDSWCLKFEETDFHVFCNLYLRVKVLIMLPRGESKMMKIVLKFRNTQLLKFPFSFQFYGKYVRSSFLFIDSVMALERLFTWYFEPLTITFQVLHTQIYSKYSNVLVYFMLLCQWNLGNIWINIFRWLLFIF